MQHLIENNIVNLLQMKSVPLHIALVISSTFTHCKEKYMESFWCFSSINTLLCSNSMYKEYLDEIQHILSLFKETQEIHRKLLQILKFHVQENLSEVEVTLFKQGKCFFLLFQHKFYLLRAHFKSLLCKFYSYECSCILCILLAHTEILGIL